MKMDKKQYLLTILKQLEPIWSLSLWFISLLENWNFEDDILDQLIEAISWSIHEVKLEKDKIKMQKWLEIMQKMKDLEDKSNESDKKDLEELDNLLENF